MKLGKRVTGGISEDCLLSPSQVIPTPSCQFTNHVLELLRSSLQVSRVLGHKGDGPPNYIINHMEMIESEACFGEGIHGTVGLEPVFISGQGGRPESEWGHIAFSWSEIVQSNC